MESVWVVDAFDALLQLKRLVPAFELAKAHGISSIPTEQLRLSCAGLREQGFLRRAAVVSEELVRRNPLADGLRRSIAGELAVLEGNVDARPSSSGDYAPHPGRVIVAVGTSRPYVDSTNTRQTHELAISGPIMGADVSIVTQMGVGSRSSYEVENFDGVAYHRIPGPKRGAVPFDEWFRLHVLRLSNIVRKVRPSLLVATSDVVNGMAVQAIAAEYDVPFVYDFRGAWEDAWLSRQRQRYAWSEDQVPHRWGMPDTYVLRRARESELFAAADAVVVGTSEHEAYAVAGGADPERVCTAAPGSVGRGGWPALMERLNVVTAGAATLAELDYSPEELTERVSNSKRLSLGKVEQFAGWGSAETIREIGWQYLTLEPIRISVPFDWRAACSDNRSQAFQLHAWNFMVPFLVEWEVHRKRDDLLWCLERAADWAENFNDGMSHGTLAWYDMALGLRLPRLAYLIQEAVFAGVAQELLAPLARAAATHQRRVFASESFNVHNNHGFYTAIGQLSFAKRLCLLPGMEIVRAQANDRLRAVVTTQFADDGGHLEHSPDYHRMLLSSFLGAMSDGLLDDPEIASRVETASEVMGWFLRPDRTIVQIGDSPMRLSAGADPAMSAPHTAFLVTDGREGEPNPQELLVLPKSGYAIVRSPQPHARGEHRSAGYLTLMAGFHSRTHKHADDLSITWFDAGHELLIDAGRFGYLEQLPADSPQRDDGFFYGRPERQYVERTRAHNTVEADGVDHDRRNRRPYGSAVVLGENVEGQFRLVGEVDHGFWVHRRTVRYWPGVSVLVEDHVRAQDGRPHDFRVWWKLSEELLTPRTVGADTTFSLKQGGTLTISALERAELIDPVKGHKDPLRGWRSKVDEEITPAWSLAHSATAREEYTFRTLLRLDLPSGMPLSAAIED